MPIRSEVLFIGGRSGVGKSAAAFELHAKLSALGIAHAVIEGDNLDLAFPPPWEHNLAERNLAAVWANYRALGYRRLIYTNTVSVRYTEQLAAAMGDDPAVTAALLTSSDRTAAERLAARIQGTDLRGHQDRSRAAARELEELTPKRIPRIDTDGRTVSDVAGALLDLAGWAGPASAPLPPAIQPPAVRPR